MASRNYVNNRDFLNALVEYFEKCDAVEHAAREAAVAAGQDPEDVIVKIPVVPDYIGECIFSIATKLATKSNFSGYPYRDDMVMDGVENCLKYIRNFDPEKSDNPFAYFTSIIWYAFLRRINKEKKQMYIRYKSSQQVIASGETYDGDAQLNLNTGTDYIDAFIEDYESKMNLKSKKKTGTEDG